VDIQTARDYIEDLKTEVEHLIGRVRELEGNDECPAQGIPRPNLKLYQLTDDIPLVFWDLHIYAQAEGFIRVTTFMSADKKKTDHTVESGPTLAGPWRELRRHL
jgi:hypothetical protein